MIDEKKTVALILAQLEPHEGIAIGIEPDEGEVELSPEEQLHAVAGELVEATRCGDVQAVAEALRGAFLLLDSMPHVEGSHLSEQAEESEPEEYGHEAEPVSHELRERFGGYREAEEEGHAYGGRARRRYSAGGKVRRRGYADGGEVDDGSGFSMPKAELAGSLPRPGPVLGGPARSPELEALTSRARTMVGQAGGIPTSPGVYSSGPSTMSSRDALARALARSPMRR